MVLQHYASGMDTAAIEKAGLEPHGADARARSRVASPKDHRRRRSRACTRRHGRGFEFGVQPDAKDSTRYLAELARAASACRIATTTSSTTSARRKLRDGYRKHVARMFELAGDDAGRPPQRRRACSRSRPSSRAPR
jgi:putative endopeptidase